MTQQSETINTGIAELDRDLYVFNEVVETPLFELIKNTVADKSVRVDQLSALIPAGFIRVAAVLSSTKPFENLRNQVNENVRPMLDKARDFVVEKLPGLMENPGILTFLGEIASQESQEEVDSDTPNSSLNQITKIGYFSSFLGSPPNLIPAVRLSFQDSKGNRLLDSTLDWDDLVFLTASTASIAREQFENAIRLHESNLLALGEKERARIAKRFAQIQEDLHHLQETFPKYGIKIESGEVKEEKNPSPPIEHTD
jgi:hypothetical protein